jgi:hypothetical protein
MNLENDDHVHEERTNNVNHADGTGAPRVRRPRRRLLLAGLATGPVRPGGPGRFNIAAFFFSGLWLGYRKMYAVMFLLFGVLLAETVLEEVLFVGLLKWREAPAGLSLLVTLIVSIVVAVCGNGWYLSHARRVIADVRAQGLSEGPHLKALAERGGTNLGASLGLCALFVVVAGLVGLVLGAVLGPR